MRKTVYVAFLSAFLLAVLSMPVAAQKLETGFLPGVDHNGATNTAYARADLIEWMLKQRRR